MTTALALSTGAELGACHATIAQHSKSFALAAKLLPAAARDDAARGATKPRREARPARAEKKAAERRRAVKKAARLPPLAPR